MRRPPSAEVDQDFGQHLSARRKALQQRVLAGGLVTSAEIARLERLEALAGPVKEGGEGPGTAQARGGRGAASGRRWILAGILGAVITLLLSCEDPSKLVSLEVIASGVTFTAGEEQPLSSPREPLLLSRFSATGAYEVCVPSALGCLDGRDGGLGSLSLQLWPNLEGSPAGDLQSGADGPTDALPQPSLTLAAPLAFPGHQVRLSGFPRAAGYLLEVGCNPEVMEEPAQPCVDLALAVSTEGSIGYLLPELGEMDSLPLPFPRPFALSFRAADRPWLELVPAEAGEVELAWQVRVRELTFQTTEELERRNRPSLVRHVSEIHSGELRFPKIPGSIRKLYRGQDLVLEDVEGILHSVSLDPDRQRLRVIFEGEIGRIYSGDRSLRPWLIDRILASEWGRFLCGIGLSMLLVAMGIQRVIQVEMT